MVHLGNSAGMVRDAAKYRQGEDWMRIAAVVLASLGLIAACTGTSSETASLTAAPTVVVTQAPAGVSEDCVNELEDFLDALNELDSRLSIGMAFASYSEHVADARVAYDRIDTENLDLTCVSSVGAPAEDAMNAYIRAYNIWNDCIGDTDCSNDDIKSDLQSEWADATAKLDAIKEALP